jgi:hypothetical protein
MRERSARERRRPQPQARERTCLYCGETKPWPAAFTREHVVSHAAGWFENNLPRLRCVCEDCNTYFGRALESTFFWGTIEAYLRLYYGAEPAHHVSNLTAGRLAFALQVPGPWDGVRLTAVHEDDKVIISLVPQVGFETVQPTGWVYVTRDELVSGAPLPPAACPALGLKLIVPNKDVERELIDLLAQRGIQFQERGPMPPPPTEDEHVCTTIQTPIDDVVRRYVAKLAVNYLVHVAGPEFALRPCFDPIRNYVRFGIVPGWRFFSMTDQSPLSDETESVRYTRGHIIGVHWPRRSHDILAQVRLFNGPTYRLVLARNVREVWRPITRGQFFDPHTRRTSRLVSFEATTAAVRHRGGIVTRVPVIRPW